MSVIYQQKGGGGLLGTLGMLASLGSKFIPGAQWLTPLGMGLTAASGNISGAMSQGLSGLKEGGFFDQLFNNQGVTQGLTGAELTKKWSPFLYDSTGGYDEWLQ